MASGVDSTVLVLGCKSLESSRAPDVLAVVSAGSRMPKVMSGPCELTIEESSRRSGARWGSIGGWFPSLLVLLDRETEPILMPIAALSCDRGDWRALLSGTFWKP